MPPSILVADLTEEPRRDERRAAAEVVELIGNQDAVGLSIMIGIRHILLAARLAMNAVFLKPLFRFWVPPIDVVTHHGSPAAMADRALAVKFLGVPILVKRQAARHFHRVDAAPRSLQLRATHAYYPSAIRRQPADNRHAARKCAYSVERIRREPKIVPHHVNVDFGHGRLAV